MNFPITKTLKVKSYTIILALSIEDKIRSEIYGRKYYRVLYEDNSEYIFLTTNEPDYQYNTRFIDVDFSLVINFENMVEDFEKTELIGLVIDAGFNSPPKYIYYDIITIDKSLKPKLLEHLKNGISGYTELDHTRPEQNQLNKWVTALES